MAPQSPAMIHTVEHADSTWVDVVSPDEAEIHMLERMHGLSRELLDHALDPHELPRIRHTGSATLLVLRAPRFDAAQALPYATVPFGIVLMPELVVTVSQSESELRREMRTYLGTLEHGFKPHRVILRALDALAASYLKHLTWLDEEVDRLEDRLTASTENREVLGLLKLQKGLTYFTTALRATEIVVERLRHTPVFAIPEEDHEEFEDVLIEVRQALSMTITMTDILSDLMDAFASIISNNLNLVLRVLTALTVILAVPALISGLYGMNVPLPFASHPAAFWGIVGGSVLAALIAALILRHKRWM